MNQRIGFMQGRLCDQVDGKIQAFPILEWKNEFPKAADININLLEWTLDQKGLYENPFMNSEGQNKIKTLCNKYSISIKSVTGDCFMQDPFWKTNQIKRAQLQNTFLDIVSSCAKLKIKFLVVPLVDNGRLETMDEENILIDFLISNLKYFKESKVSIIFESDYQPKNLFRFINLLPISNFGINYDTGNSAALGLDPIEEIPLYGDRIRNVHIKDRIFNGTTVPLQKGNVNFKSVFQQLSLISYQGNFILQTARSTNGDHATDLSLYRDLTLDWLLQYNL